MSNTSAPQKAAGPILSRVPPDEQFWRRYSPHGEAPLSIAGSIALHTLGLGAALLAIFYLASLFSPSTQSLPVEPVRLDIGGGGGSKTGVGDVPGVGHGPENIGPEVVEPQTGVEVAPTRPSLDPVETAKVQKEFDQDTARYFKETPTEQGKAFVGLDEKIRRKLADGLQPGKGKGGPGSGGGDGTGKGPGEGSGTGPGKQATLNQRERRMLRWHMKFEARNGVDYLAQLRGLGAILAFPVTEGADPTYKVVHDLRRGQAKLETEDLSKIQRIYWIDDKPKSVQDILDALGLRLPRTPSRFVAFMPQKLEDDLFAQEKSYVEKILRQPLREDKIEETLFRAVRTPRGYKAELISVSMKP